MSHKKQPERKGSWLSKRALTIPVVLQGFYVLIETVKLVILVKANLQ